MIYASFVSILMQNFPFFHNLAILLFSEIVFDVDRPVGNIWQKIELKVNKKDTSYLCVCPLSSISNGNRTSCRAIRSVIILVINKSDSRCAVVRFCYHSYDYRPNWTPLSPIAITN